MALALIAFTSADFRSGAVPSAHMLAYIAFAAAMTSVAFSAIAGLLQPYRVAALTAPFVLVGWLFLFAVLRFENIESGPLTKPVSPDEYQAAAYILPTWYMGIGNAVGQIFFQDNWITGYLIALTRAKTRFDLDGQPAGELSDEHRNAAQEELTRRRGITEARRAEEDRGRQERAQLLRDFSRTTLTPANFCALKGLTQEQLDAQLKLAREEEAQQPPRQERHDRPPRGQEHRRGGPRGEGRPGGPGQAPRGDGPRRDGRPNEGHKPPRQPR